MKCFACEGELVILHHVHEENVGGVRVQDSSAGIPTCNKCGERFISVRDKQMHELRAAAVVLRDSNGARVNGDVLRYARKALGLRQVDLAKLLGRGTEWISRWENGATAANRTDQLAIVALLDDAWRRLYCEEDVSRENAISTDEKPLEVPPIPERRRALG